MSNTTATTPPLATPEHPLVARAGGYYRNVRYLICAGILAAAGWFAFDGWVNWPKHDAEWDRLTQEVQDKKNAGDFAGAQQADDQLRVLKKRHGDFDIAIQRRLAMGLPFGAIALLFWTLHNSRGEYRFDGKTLNIPGHPPIEVGHITAIDNARWDRKGIAYVEYKTADGQSGSARLDDFVYERPPTDAIYKQLVEILTPTEENSDSGEHAGLDAAEAEERA